METTKNEIRVIRDDCDAAIYVNGNKVGQPYSFDDGVVEPILKALGVPYDLVVLDNWGYDSGFPDDFGLEGYPDTWAEVEAAQYQEPEESTS
jgi:hypothetical protein